MFVLLFLVTFFSILLGLHYFPFRRLSRIFDFTYSWKVFLPVVVLIFANFSGAVFMSRSYSNAFIRGWLIANESYLGGLWITFCFLAGYAVIQGLTHVIHPIPANVSRYVVVGGLTLLLGYSIWNGQRMTVKRIEVASDKIVEPITVVQLSDLHIGSFHRKGFVGRIVAQTNALDPDLVVFTGGLLDIGVTKEPVTGFRELQAPAFFAWGNHEQFLKPGTTEEILSEAPMTILKNERVIFDDSLHIVGLDYIEEEAEGDARPLLTSLVSAKDSFTMLLLHAPIDFPALEGHNIDLELAGHTHSGQIFPFTLLVKAKYSLVAGLYRSGDQSVYVSSGTGTWGPPMRLGSSNEITVFHLIPHPPEREEELLVRRIDP